MLVTMLARARESATIGGWTATAGVDMRTFLAGFLAISAAAFSPATTDRITITGNGITAEIADKVLVETFRFGPGPGTSFSAALIGFH
jgi:hypothetical protein